MPSKRQPSKQRRAAQNRAARSALAVRRENAARVAEQAAATTKSSGADDAPDTTKPTSMRQRAAARGGYRDVPGGRAALLAVLFALGAGASLMFLKVPVDEDGNVLKKSELEEREDAGKPEIDESFLKAFGPLAIGYAVVPAAAAGAGFWAVRNRRGARWLTGALIALVLSTFASGATILFLPAAAALAVASYQVRKAERLVVQSDAPATEDDDEPEDDESV